MKSADETRPVELSFSQQKCPTHFRRAIIRNDQNNSLKRLPEFIWQLLQFGATEEYITIIQKSKIFEKFQVHLSTDCADERRLERNLKKSGLMYR